MPAQMFVQTLPPGEMEPLTCKDCGGDSFQLKAEVRDGNIEAFHSLCTGCGKRGMLVHEVETTVTRKFTQYADPPPGFGGGFTVTPSK